jgi:photosystem II stability/assembly factor-like uncharacterized protein
MYFSCCLRHPDQVVMLDADRGWLYATDDAAMGTASLSFYRTNDGGMRWEKVYDSNDQIQIDPQNTIFESRNPFGYSGFILNDFNTALYATGSLYQSTNGGKGWLRISLPVPPAATDLEAQAGVGTHEPDIAVPNFWTNRDGVMVGRYYTEEALPIPPTRPVDLPAAEFFYLTHDGGKSWTNQRSPARMGNAFFRDANTGWYLGVSDADPSTPTQLYQTTDGGQTWEQLMFDCPLPLGSEIHFIDSQVGYAYQARYSDDYVFDARASERSPSFYFTVDGGHNWAKAELVVAP